MTKDMNELNNRIDAIIGVSIEEAAYGFSESATEEMVKIYLKQLQDRTRSQLIALITEQVRLGRIDELETLDYQSNPACQGCWHTQGAVADRLAELKSTTKEDV